MYWLSQFKIFIMNEDIIRRKENELTDYLLVSNPVDIPNILNGYDEQNRVLVLSHSIAHLRSIGRQDVINRIKKHCKYVYINAEILRSRNSVVPRQLDLSDLSLRSSEFQSLMTKILTIEGLDTLGLCNNNMTFLSSDIAQLETLKNLYITGNHITSIPIEIVESIEKNGLHIDICNNHNVLASQALYLQSMAGQPQNHSQRDQTRRGRSQSNSSVGNRSQKSLGGR